MAVKIVRPRTDSALLPLTVGGTAVFLVAGWFLGAWVFKPEHMEALPGGGGDGPVEVGALPEVDAGAVVPLATRDAGSLAAVVVPVRLGGGLLSACGDGEEMNLAGRDCDTPPGLESALRVRLASVLATCPAAVTAARDPSRALSLGLRVDFQRHTVVSLLGRSTSVPDKVTYVPCVNAALRSLDEVWRIQAAHPRYQYYFTAHFGPMRAPEVAPTPTGATPTVTPAAPLAPAAPAPAVADAGVPDSTLPTAAQMLRMPAMSQTTVTWTTAIVREAPRTGPIVGRVPQNTPVEVIDRRGSWYGIRWDRTHVGWTYGEAIGQGR